MSVFISYNHKDKEFVDKLSLKLVYHNVKVWKDEWNISVGDSFIDKIQEALEKASYICVVFSHSSIKSEWVSREINAGLIREIEDKNLTILPIVIDDCKIPLLLRDKIYANFREDFDEGLKKLLVVLKKKYNLDNNGRINKESNYYIDYQIDVGTIADSYSMRIDVISYDTEEDYSILTRIDLVGNKYINKKYLELQDEQSIKDYVLNICSVEAEKKTIRLSVAANNDSKISFTISDSQNKAKIGVHIVTKKLGIDTGNITLFNVGALFSQILMGRKN